MCDKTESNAEVALQHLSVIFGQEKNQTTVAGGVAYAPVVVQGLGKEFCLFSLGATVF